MTNEMTTTRVRFPVAPSMFLLAWLFVTPLASANDAAAQQVFPTADAAVGALVSIPVPFIGPIAGALVGAGVAAYKTLTED